MSGHDARADAEIALAELRLMHALEYDRAGRIATSAQHAAAYAGAVYAVVQTTAFTSFAELALTATERALVLGLSIGAGLVLAASGAAAVATSRLRRVEETSPREIAGALDRSREDDVPIVRELVRRYVSAVEARGEASESRLHMLRLTRVLALAAAGLSATELLFAMVARI